MICEECKKPITSDDIFVTSGLENRHVRCIRDPNALRKFVDGTVHLGCMNWKTTLLKFKDHS